MGPCRNLQHGGLHVGGVFGGNNNTTILSFRRFYGKENILINKISNVCTWSVGAKAVDLSRDCDDVTMSSAHTNCRPHIVYYSGSRCVYLWAETGNSLLWRLSEHRFCLMCVNVNVCVLMFVSRSSGASLGRLQWGGDDPTTDPRSVSGEQKPDTLCYCVNTIAVLPFLVECLLSECRTREISCATHRLVSSSTSTWSRCILWLQWCWRRTSSSTACALTWFQNSQYSSTCVWLHADCTVFTLHYVSISAGVLTRHNLKICVCVWQCEGGGVLEELFLPSVSGEAVGSADSAGSPAAAAAGRGGQGGHWGHLLNRSDSHQCWDYP